MKRASRQISTWSPFVILIVFVLGTVSTIAMHAQDAYQSQENAVKLAVMQSQLKDLEDLGSQVNAIKLHAQESDDVIRQLKDEMDSVFSVAKWIAFGVSALIGMQAWRKLYPSSDDGESRRLDIH